MKILVYSRKPLNAVEKIHLKDLVLCKVIK